MSIISNVYYFGASKDGFNIYPDSNLFNSFYRNATPEPWFISVRKINSIIHHTYVQYGLKTSHNEGRNGSHIGISIAIKNAYFGDLKFLHQIFTDIINEMLKGGHIIKENEFKQIAHVPYRLSDEKVHLDEWTKIIQNYFEKEEISQHIKQISSETPACLRDLYGLHINNSKEVIQNHFEKYAGIDVADIADYPLIKV